MDGSLGHFKATLQRRKERSDKKGNKYPKPSLKKGKKVDYNFPKLTDEELENFRNELLIKSKIRSRKILLITVVIFIILVILLFQLLR